MIKLIPSISVLNGKIARLTKGDFQSKKKYDKSPVDFARMFEDLGIEVIHLVDLKGVIDESPGAFNVLETIKGHTKLKVEFAGGIRTDGDINKLLEYGADYLSIASVAAQKPDLFTSWLFSYGRELLALSADTKDGLVMVKGWQKKIDKDLFDHISYFYERGLKYIKVTDISRDGTMVGPNFDLYEKLVKTYPDASIIASGGVRSDNDISKLQDAGLYAVVFGKAFYEGKLSSDDLKKFIP